jgi:putative glutathione S-transferase
MSDPTFSGRVTVPVLFDKETNKIVCNESAEIIKMLNEEFAEATGPDYYPEPLREEVESVNEVIYDKINNGVYKSGFA